MSENSFKDYVENSDTDEHNEIYFGWLNTLLPDYPQEDMEGIKTNVITQGKGMRPLIEIQKDQDFQSRFVEDYHQGISEEESLKRIENLLKK